MSRLILGSQSPRRREILNYFSIPFDQIASSFDEEAVPFCGNPAEYVRTLSLGKASTLQASYSDRPILSADTIVYKHGKVYGKPADRDEAIATLEQLSGQWHSVYTGICLLYGSVCYQNVEETRVLFNPLSLEQIVAYHDGLYLYDKAGSYQIQMAGGVAVKKIDGCYYNAIGMPINSIREALKQLNIDLWSYLK